MDLSWHRPSTVQVVQVPPWYLLTCWVLTSLPCVRCLLACLLACLACLACVGCVPVFCVPIGPSYLYMQYYSVPGVQFLLRTSSSLCVPVEILIVLPVVVAS